MVSNMTRNSIVLCSNLQLVQRVHNLYKVQCTDYFIPSQLCLKIVYVPAVTSMTYICLDENVIAKPIFLSKGESIVDVCGFNLLIIIIVLSP